MRASKRTVLGGIVIVGVLWYAGAHSDGLTPTTTPPAATPTQNTAPTVSAPDCFTVPADGQSHPCDIPDPPVTTFTVTDHGSYHPDGDCWSLGMDRATPGGSQSLRTCVPKADYDAHPVGSTYTVGGPGTGLSGGTATRVTDGG